MGKDGEMSETGNTRERKSHMGRKNEIELDAKGSQGKIAMSSKSKGKDT